MQATLNGYDLVSRSILALRCSISVVQSYWECKICVLLKCFIVLIARLCHQKLYHALLHAEREKENMHRPAAKNNKTQTPKRRNQTPEKRHPARKQKPETRPLERSTHQKTTPRKTTQEPLLLSSPKLHACCWHPSESEQKGQQAGDHHDEKI